MHVWAVMVRGRVGVAAAVREMRRVGEAEVGVGGVAVHVEVALWWVYLH